MTELAAILFDSTPVNLLAMAAAGAAAGMYLFYRGFRLLQRKRLILNTPASKIRSASMGLVEINGLAIGPYVINSPLKQTNCYYYRSVAWQWKQRGKDSEWVKVAEETLHVPFYMDDSSGRLLVDPSGAEMDLHCDLHEEYNGSIVSSGPEMPGSVFSFLSRHGVDSSKRIKVEEYCIRPKDDLFVLGTLSQNPGLDASVMPTWAGHSSPRSAAASVSVTAPGVPALVSAKAGGDGNGNGSPQIVRLSGDSVAMPATEMTQQQKIAAALVKAGITSPLAWAAAGVSPQAAAQVGPYSPSAVATSAPEKAGTEEKSLETNETFDLHPPVVLMKGTHEATFLISWRSQRDLVLALGWKSTLMIWGGPALTLVSVYVLLAHFNWL
jgi:E3 Ubiquitin ligase